MRSSCWRSHGYLSSPPRLRLGRRGFEQLTAHVHAPAVQLGEGRLVEQGWRVGFHTQAGDSAASLAADLRTGMPGLGLSWSREGAVGWWAEPACPSERSFSHMLPGAAPSWVEVFVE